MSRTYLLKIYKPGTKIYRTALVPGNTTLDALHRAIHEWMGFPSYEMYGFFPNNKLLSEAGYYAPQMHKQSADTVTLDQLHLRREQRFLYVYDMTELMQFYIFVEDIEDREIPEIRLLRRNGQLSFNKPQEPEEMPLPEDPDTWRIYMQGITMKDCIASNMMPVLLDTAHSMNIRIQGDRLEEEIAEDILAALKEEDALVLRMLPVYLIHTLRELWQTPDGEILSLPYDFILRLSLLGFLTIEETENDRVLYCSEEAQDWFVSLLEKPINMRDFDMYGKWSAVARGILYTYGVIQMDDFYQMFLKYTNEEPDIDEVCDFMMQRMEWNEECHAIQDDEDLYWSIPEPEKADIILKKRRQNPREYKNVSKKEILENADSAGWQNVEKGQELFEALQGMALQPDDIREILQDIVRDFTKGMEPYEVMRDCIPPENIVGKAAYSKIRMLLREVKRQLPDYVYMGYSVEEIESTNAQIRTIEGIQILRGGRK